MITAIPDNIAVYNANDLLKNSYNIFLILDILCEVKNAESCFDAITNNNYQIVVNSQGLTPPLLPESSDFPQLLILV